MRRIFYVFLVLWSFSSALGQGSFDVLVDLTGKNVVPANSSVFRGTASIRFNENSLNYGIDSYFPFSPTGGGIYGPATAGQNAKSVFDIFTLGSFYTFAPDGQGNPGGYAFRGVMTVSDAQKQELFQGLWYVSLNSEAFPDGEIRGQIPAVPEPSTLGLLGLGLGLVGLGFWRKSS